MILVLKMISMESHVHGLILEKTAIFELFLCKLMCTTTFKHSLSDLVKNSNSWAILTVEESLEVQTILCILNNFPR